MLLIKLVLLIYLKNKNLSIIQMDSVLPPKEKEVPLTLETKVLLLEQKCNELVNKLNELGNKLMVVYEKLSQDNIVL